MAAIFQGLHFCIEDSQENDLLKYDECASQLEMTPDEHSSASLSQANIKQISINVSLTVYKSLNYRALCLYI